MDTLTQQSINIIKENKKLLIFSVISTVLTIGTFVVGLIPLFQIETNAWKDGGYVSGKTFLIFIVILLAIFLIVGIVTLLFNAGLTVCALKHIQKKSYTISDGFRSMLTFFVKIFLIKVFYDGIAIFVKLMRYWVDGWTTSSLSLKLTAGLPWNDAVYLLLPTLVSENTSFLSALFRSAELIKNKWGADVTLRSNLFNKLLSAAGIIAFLPVIIGFVIGGNKAIMIGAIITVILTTTKTIIQSATQIILSCGIYLYCIDYDASTFFDTELLKKSFRPLSKKELHIGI